MLLWVGAVTVTSEQVSAQTALAADYGIRFSCSAKQLQELVPSMQAYLERQGIAPRFVQVTLRPEDGSVTYSLVNTSFSTGTLYLAWRGELGIEDEILRMPIGNGKTRSLRTVSKKEILFAMLHPGRLTEFNGAACNVQALADQVGLRQNVVAWSEDITWDWPDGTPANWNPRYWKKGTPVPGVALHDALNDMFFHQHKYGIGCYTATKVVYAQATLDYYRRVKKDPATARMVEERLMADGDPLVQIEPGSMWSFEEDFDPSDMNRQGKMVRVHEAVAPGNFIPGDWLYFRNTDPKTWDKTGYEGSNSVYLGRNRFDDYYNDNNHHYNYDEKIVEVFQWRHGVFSRSRDWAKRVPVSPEQIDLLSKSPEDGGLLMAYRVVPYKFGFEVLPPLNTVP